MSRAAETPGRSLRLSVLQLENTAWITEGLNWLQLFPDRSYLLPGWTQKAREERNMSPSNERAVSAGQITPAHSCHGCGLLTLCRYLRLTAVTTVIQLARSALMAWKLQCLLFSSVVLAFWLLPMVGWPPLSHSLTSKCKDKREILKNHPVYLFS